IRALEHPFRGVTHYSANKSIAVHDAPDGPTVERTEHIEITKIDLTAPGIAFEVSPYVAPTSEEASQFEPAVDAATNTCYQVFKPDPVKPYSQPQRPTRFYHETVRQTTPGFLESLNRPTDRRA